MPAGFFSRGISGAWLLSVSYPENFGREAKHALVQRAMSSLPSSDWDAKVMSKAICRFEGWSFGGFPPSRNCLRRGNIHHTTWPQNLPQESSSCALSPVEQKFTHPKRNLKWGLLVFCSKKKDSSKRILKVCQRTTPVFGGWACDNWSLHGGKISTGGDSLILYSVRSKYIPDINYQVVYAFSDEAPWNVIQGTGLELLAWVPNRPSGQEREVSRNIRKHLNRRRGLWSIFLTYGLFVYFPFSSLWVVLVADMPAG